MSKVILAVDSVSDEDARLLKRLDAHGVIPGARLQVTSASPDECSADERRL